MRADLYLFQMCFVKSRQKAKFLIEEGNVKIDGLTVTKSSADINEALEHTVEIKDTCPYVSRGGLKLEGLLKLSKFDVNNKICVDIGASTGGFTHCLLLNGAKRVYAIDSGTDQLASELKNDNRVASIENFNARELSLEVLGEKADIVTIDVSFISQNHIIPRAAEILTDGGVYLSLIKPQFEVGKANVGKGGIVKDKHARLNGVMSVIDCAAACGLICLAFDKSPIQGGDGNTEYIAVFAKNGTALDRTKIKKIVLE